MSKHLVSDSTAAISTTGNGITLSGRLDAAGTAQVWDAAVQAARGGSGSFAVDASGLTYLDGSGCGLLMELRLIRKEQFALNGLSGEHQKLFDMFNPELVAPVEKAPARLPLIEEIGRQGERVWIDIQRLIRFVGESSMALFHAVRHPRLVRWSDFWRTCEEAGLNAMPIILLIGFLMGLVMAFQSAIPLKRFGADIFVADLLGISMVRELGPLVTAILLAGRSGAAFAAEIGTMKVNEEVDALTTMGLDPLRFLAVPRILGAMAMMPILTTFFILIAMVGGCLVTMSFGYSPITFVHRSLDAIKMGDFIGGIFKAVVFSLLVAGVGCLRGLTTGTGASAVGNSTTSAVVSGLILLAFFDGIFAVCFYALGI